MTDLFLTTKVDQLWHWMKDKRFIRTSDIVRWGSQNYCNDAPRLARKFREAGRIRRLTQQEMINYGYGNTKEKIYTVKET